MPSVSTPQHNFMEIIAHDPAKAKAVEADYRAKRGPPAAVISARPVRSPAPTHDEDANMKTEPSEAEKQHARDFRFEAAIQPEDEANRPLLEEAWGALNFILAFYEPGQRYLDTNAWKQAEASGRRVHAKLREALDRPATPATPIPTCASASCP